MGAGFAFAGLAGLGFDGWAADLVPRLLAAGRERLGFGWVFERDAGLAAAFFTGLRGAVGRARLAIVGWTRRYLNKTVKVRSR
jgi:hypothetical protein